MIGTTKRKGEKKRMTRPDEWLMAKDATWLGGNGQWSMNDWNY
jgi:hypothetical protein